jgi:hypothetical protein
MRRKQPMPSPTGCASPSASLHRVRSICAAAPETTTTGATAGYERVTLRDSQALVARTPPFLRLKVE